MWIVEGRDIVSNVSGVQYATFYGYLAEKHARKVCAWLNATERKIKLAAKVTP